MTGIPPRTWCWPIRSIGGKPLKPLLHADRNGLFYVLDRSNGKFLWAKPFVRQTWNFGFDKDGKPIVDPGAAASPAGKEVFPRSGHEFSGAVL